jgi:microcystin-dependent protein
VALQANELAGHTHAWMAATAVADRNTPAGNLLAATASEPLYDTATDPTQITPLNESACGATSGGQPHGNVMPGIAINYIICLNGLYPERP